MKTVGPLLAVIGLLLLYRSDGLAPPQKSICCPKVNLKGIPINTVKNISKTTSTCKLEAYIVTDVNQTKSCISPKSPWIKKNRNKLETILGGGLM